MAKIFVALLFASHSASLCQAHAFLASGSHHASTDLHGAGASAAPVTVEDGVVRKGIEEMAIASGARKQALASSKDAAAVRENIIANQGIDRTEASYLKVKPVLSTARAQLLTVHKFAAEAKLHAQHAMDVLVGSKQIVQAAAQKAVEATKGWVMSDAAGSAAAVTPSVDNRAERLAGAVASAAEPYHLMLLRRQKSCEETYAKAKSAHRSAAKLIEDSKKVALQSQQMQASGMGVEAQQTWSMASGMIKEAEVLRQWGVKLYGRASAACGNAGADQMMEQQAAAHAAASPVTSQ